MKRSISLPLSGVLLALFCTNAMAVQTGQIYRSQDGEWMCIDKWGNEIPPSSSGGWTVVSPPRTIGGECNNRRVVFTNTNVQIAPAQDLAPFAIVPEAAPTVVVGPALR